MTETVLRPGTVFRRWLLAVTVTLAGVVPAAGPGSSNAQTIDGSIWYRDRFALPPSAEIRVLLEDVARMDVPADVIASTRVEPKGGPPWSFSLPYDPDKLQERGRYVVRVRIEDAGRLLFVNTQSTPAFGRDPETPLDIRVSRVPSNRPDDGKGSGMSDVSLTDTYWKLVELGSQGAELGAGKRELQMVLTTGERRVRGFSGCNRFTGSYQRDRGRLQFEQLASTRMACAEGMAQEQRFLSALREAHRYTIDADELALYTGDERLLMRFVAVALP
ncbi:META domain-containing protein [uncultured Thiohalocapsa sp.]|uniref:META domain-containing protein n=1 Tax=uncultured Thiohalocapsa sp. TaxID=768990 RepID=UPI0025E3A45A|nr:META domain-containing protein [uncultured Thiohalocapsa sp.]